MIDHPTEALLVLAGVALKGTLVLAAAAAATHFLRSSSAAFRHRVWALAMASVLLLPFLAAVVQLSSLSPLLQISLLPAPAENAAVFVETAEGTASSPSVATTTVDGATPPFKVGSPPVVASSPAPRTYLDWRDAGLWVPALLLIWLVGALILMARFAVDTCATWWITRRAFQNDTVGSVRIAFSNDVDVPLTWGWLHPVILLPRTALRWPEAKHRAVVLHELAHIRRGDYPVHVIARMSLALNWFNPLAWHASRQMVIEREKACDDVVLLSGSAPADYASLLLDIARTILRRGVAVHGGLHIARRSELRSRITAVVSPGVDRSPVTGRQTLLASIAIVCSLPLLTGLQLWSDPQARRVDISTSMQEAATASPNSDLAVAKGDTLLSAPPQTFSTRPESALDMLYSADAHERARAACTAGLLQTAEAIPILIDMLADGVHVSPSNCDYRDQLRWQPAYDVWVSPTPGESAAVALAAMGGVAVDHLVAALDDEDATARRNAAWAIGEVRLHEQQEKARDPLLGLLADDDPSVRMTAAWALGEHGDPVAVDGLLAVLADPTWQVRERAARALGELRTSRGEVGLVGALRDPVWQVRLQAAWALGELGSRSAGPALRVATRDVHASVREAAQSALVDMGFGSNP